MKTVTMPTTEHLRVSLKAWRSFHVKRALACRYIPELRKFHREAARAIAIKLKAKRNRVWSWEEFIKAWENK
jgi:hypothetical protein